MKIYSNGKDRTLTGSFPARFKLLNNGVDVPFIRTGKDTIRLSGKIPYGELDVEEIARQKTAQLAQLGTPSIAFINRNDFDKIDVLNKKIAIAQSKLNEQMASMTEHEATLANLESENAKSIGQINESLVEMAGVFGKEIQADREKIKSTAKSIAKDIADSSEVLNAKIESHEKARNPHKITKDMIGLDKVENTSDLDKPVSKANQKALDKKADKTDIEDVRKEIKATEKKQDRLVRAIDSVNLAGGIGGNELPSGGKKGQVLAKKSNKTGDYEWTSASGGGVTVHNDLTGRSASDAHPISAITGLQSALSSETTNRENADNGLQSQIDAITASSDVKDIVGTYEQLQAYDTSTLGNNDIIKVLQDETHDNETTYYRWSTTTETFTLIGEEGPYYTKSEANSTFVPQTRTVNGKALSSNISLTASDVGALPDSTVIPTVNNPTITLTQGGVTKGTFTLNQSSNKTIDFEATGATGANTSLSNLTSTGKNIGNWSTNLSNCITEIPQDINLTLSSGTLTLKSGSIITFPGGSQYQTTEDKTVSTGLNNGLNFICLYESTFNMAGRPVANSVSGAGATTRSGFAYDTTANKVGFYNISGQLTSYCSFPFCIVNVESGVITSIYKVFNGAGYIGHHAFFTPGWKGLQANRFNEDGTLKSIPFSTNILSIAEMNTTTPANGYKKGFQMSSYGTYAMGNYREVDTIAERDLDTTNYRLQYVRESNTIYYHTNNGFETRTLVVAGFYSYNGTSVTKFDIRQPVRLATTEMLDKVQDQVDTNTSAIANKQDTLVSGTNIKTINSTTVLGSGNFALATQSLSNLDSTGQMVIDSQNGTISNCITEIPQDLKFELNNGTLTLKSGSIITLPNGTQKQTTQDNSITVTQNDTWVAFPRNNGFFLNYVRLNRIGSGSTLPADDTNYQCFFNSTDGLIYLWTNSAWGVWNSALPACIFTVTNGAISSIKQVFNGAGYIGHHAFVLPGVKGLIPNGKNTDGTLRSTNIKTNSLLVLALPTYNTDNRKIVINESGFIGQQMFKPDVDTFDEIIKENWYYQYVKSDNIIYQYISDVLNTGKVVPFVSFKTQGSTVTQFDIRQPVRLATTEMIATKANDSDVVKLAGNQTIGGTKTFSSTISGSIDGNAGTVTNGVYTTGTQTITGDKTFAGSVALGSSATATTQSAGDNSTKVATTAYADTAVSNKIQLVSTLPATPTNGVLYVIPE